MFTMRQIFADFCFAYRRVTCETIETRNDLVNFIAARLMPQVSYEIECLPDTQPYICYWETNPDDIHDTVICLTCNSVGINLFNDAMDLGMDDDGAYWCSIKSDCSWNKETDNYSHMDVGSDGLRNSPAPHLWREQFGPNGPSCPFYHYFFMSCKSESAFSCGVALRAAKHYALTRWGITIKFLCVGGDMQKSLYKAAQLIQPGVKTTRDFAHVDRYAYPISFLSNYPFSVF